MSLETEHAERFGRDGEGRADGAPRDHAYAMVQLVAEVRERVLFEARAGAEQIRLAHPELISLWEASTRRESASFEEQIAGYVQRVSDDFADLIDADELKRLQRIFDTGRED